MKAEQIAGVVERAKAAVAGPATDETRPLRDIVTDLLALTYNIASTSADLQFMARRYADGRQTYASAVVNDATLKLVQLGVKLQPDTRCDPPTVWANPSDDPQRQAQREHFLEGRLARGETITDAGIAARVGDGRELAAMLGAETHAEAVARVKALLWLHTQVSAAVEGMKAGRPAK